MATAPSTLNLSMFQGNVSFTPTGGSKTHMGNCTKFTYSPTVDKLEHFSRMTPTRVKDKTVTRQVGATVALTLEEVTLENLAIFMQADPASTSLGGMSFTDQEGVLEFVGSNAVGNQVTWTGKVSFTPSGDFDMLKEDWAEILLSADVLLDQNAYGVTTLVEATTA
jgi:hypothetical protein